MFITLIASILAVLGWVFSVLGGVGIMDKDSPRPDVVIAILGLGIVFHSIAIALLIIHT